MPPDPFEQFQTRLPGYVVNVLNANTESTKAFCFLELARAVFSGISVGEPTRLIPDLEHSVQARAGAVLVKGRIDALLGNLVIEFKIDLDEARLSQAKDQLRKYIAALWAIDKQRTNYMLMASDGLHFEVFKPTAPASIQEPRPDQIALERLNSVDLETSAPADTFLWLDRYVLWRERIPPTSDEMAKDFGTDSPAFTNAMGLFVEAWEASGDAKLAPFEEWAKYLAIVYGNPVSDDKLFLKHTYLATLAKLMTYAYYSSNAIPSKRELERVLSGEAFREFGIDNFLEEDFFSWIVRGDARDRGVKAAWELLLVLQRYDLSRLSEDVLKGLYQGLVGGETRHELGEYYTPEWLAEWILDNTPADPNARILDPACGSGTFLALAIRRKKSELKLSPDEKLRSILSTVAGFDVHPLAVLIAKANFLMALGKLVDYKTEPIEIPIYLANSITFPSARMDVQHGVEVFRYDVGKKRALWIPRDAVESGIVGQCIEAVTGFARNLAGSKNPGNADDFQSALGREVTGYAQLPPGAKDALWDSCQTLAKLISGKKDSIYAFIVKNIYRPTSIGKFDLVVGNPPWISYRFIKVPEYQSRLKELIVVEHQLLPEANSELLTQMEIATLFLARCADLYLKDGGFIGFVMPRAIFTANQHDAFRRASFKPAMGFREVADLSGVSPLFNVPSAVTILEKGGTPGSPNSAIVMEGTLPERNASWKIVEELQKDGDFSAGRRDLVTISRGDSSAWTYMADQPCPGRSPRPGPSVYADSFANGAALYPRAFWWLDIEVHPKLGLNPSRPSVRTSARAGDMAKKAYKNLTLRGRIESEYLFLGLLGADTLPFAYLRPRPVFVPAKRDGKGYSVLTRQNLTQAGSQDAARWMAAVEKEWGTRRDEKSEEVDIYSYLDWGSKLSNHDSQSPHYVAYNTSGSFIAATVIDRDAVLSRKIDGHTMRFAGFLLDITAVYRPCRDRAEAAYLASLLNSTVLARLVLPFQATGLWGARHIHQKPFEIGIPKFNKKDPSHQRMVDLEAKCRPEAMAILDDVVEARGGETDVLSPQVIGRLRAQIRERLATEFEEIDKFACKILTE